MSSRAPLLLASLVAVGCGRIGLLAPFPEDGPVVDAAVRSDAGDAARPAEWPPFVVQSTITPVGGEPELLAPAGHSFTMVFDGGLATLGSFDGTGFLQVQPGADGSLGLRGNASFSFGGACGASVVYQSMTLTRAADGRLMGTGHGLARFVSGNLNETVPVTMALEGEPDHDAPSLAFPTEGDPADPFGPLDVIASEPLPPGTTATLTSSSGESVQLVPIVLSPSGPATLRAPNALLRFGEPYRIDLEGVSDFAGNVASFELTFQTRDAPPVLVEDGFELAQEVDDLGGGLLLTGAGAPVISGAKSMYVPPMAEQPSSGSTTLFTLHVNVANGDNFVTFSFRTVDVPAAEKFGIATGFSVGIVGQNPGGAAMVEPNQPKTPFELPDHTKVLVGPVHKAKLFLPSGTIGDVFVIGTGGAVTCTRPRPPLQGIIIDDVRTE